MSTDTKEMEAQESVEESGQQEVEELFDSAEPPPAAEGGEAAQQQDTAAAGEGAGEEEDPWAEALAEQLAEESAQKGGEGKEASQESYAPAPLQNLEEETERRGTGDDVDLDLILDIPVTIAMEIGRTKINIRNLLQLNQGSVVELDRLAGEPLDVRVNGTLIAHGEVVVVNEKFGIRLTDVVSAQERLKNLKK